MNAPVKIVLDDRREVDYVMPLHLVDPELPAPAPRELVSKEPDSMRRQEILARVSEDRADLVRVANSVREIAETVEAAQTTLAFTRRSLRWLLLAGSAAALTVWITSARGRRPPSALVVGLSMPLLRRWLGPSASANDKALPDHAPKHRPPAPATTRTGPA